MTAKDLEGLTFGELEELNRTLMEERAALAVEDGKIRERQLAVNAAMAALDSPDRVALAAAEQEG